MAVEVNKHVLNNSVYNLRLKGLTVLSSLSSILCVSDESVLFMGYTYWDYLI